MHLCTVHHPNGFDVANEGEHAKTVVHAPDEVNPEERTVQVQTGECCYGCECGWWRHLPDEDQVAAEEFLRAREKRSAAQARRKAGK